MKWTPTKWKRPRTGEALLWFRFRCGHVSLRPYMAREFIWDDRGLEFDIVEVARA
jgi:hypothetical protein